MVKRLSLVAFAVLAAGNANAMQIIKDAKNDVQVTGMAYAGHYFGDSKDSEAYGSSTFARFGAKGQTEINEQLSAVGTYEAQLKLNDADSEQKKDSIKVGDEVYEGSAANGTNVRTRYIFGGVDAKDIGLFTFGRQNGAAFATVGNWSDVALTDGYSSNALGTGPDMFGTQRGSDILKYTGVFGPATVAASHKFTTARDTSTEDKDNSASTLAASYEVVKNFSLGAAYTEGNRGDENVDLWLAGAKYDDKTLYAAVVYANGTDFLKSGVDHTAYETALGYTFVNGITLMTTWEKQRVEQNGTKKDGYNAYTFGAKYAFTKALSVAAEYRVNNRDKEDYGAFTEYGAGVTKVDSGDDFQLAVKYLF